MLAPTPTRGRVLARAGVGVAALALLVVAVVSNVRVLELKLHPTELERVPSWPAMLKRHDCVASLYTAIVLMKRGEDPFSDSEDAFKAKGFTPPGMEHDNQPNQSPPTFLLFELVGLSAPIVGSTEAFLRFRVHLFWMQLVSGLCFLGWVAWKLRAELPAVAVLLVPAVLACNPWRDNLHFGQTQLDMALAVAVSAVALAYGSDRVGGAALGFAAMTHLHPGILAIPLLLRRRWRALAWAAGAFAAMLGVSIVVYGWPANRAFFLERLPIAALRGRAGSSELYDAPGWVTFQISIWAMVTKLKYLGLPASSAMGLAVTKAFMLGVVVLAIVVGRRPSRGPVEDALAYIALVVCALFTNAQMHAYTLLLPMILVVLLVGRELKGDPTRGRIARLCILVAYFSLVSFRMVLTDMWTPPSALTIALSVPYTLGALVACAFALWPAPLRAASPAA